MLKSIVPSLLLVGAVASASAADAAPAQDNVLGFEFGAAFGLMNDSRLDSVGTNFQIFLPVGSRFTAGVFHETGNITGDEDGNDADINYKLTEMRFGVDVWESATQEVTVVLGFGNIDYTNDLDDSTLVGDLGIKYTPIKAKTGPVTGSLNINATYRYAEVEDQNIGLNEDADDMGGFQLGLGAGLAF